MQTFPQLIEALKILGKYHPKEETTPIWAGIDGVFVSFVSGNILTENSPDGQKLKNLEWFLERYQGSTEAFWQCDTWY